MKVTSASASGIITSLLELLEVLATFEVFGDFAPFGDLDVLDALVGLDVLDALVGLDVLDALVGLAVGGAVGGIGLEVFLALLIAIPFAFLSIRNSLELTEAPRNSSAATEESAATHTANARAKILVEIIF
jgi:hypothetical protein